MQKPNERVLVLAYLSLAGMAVIMLSCGVATTGTVKTREVADNKQSINNTKQMMLAVNNMASNTPTGDIPPAWGAFPAGEKTNKTFFYYLLPYIEQLDLFNNPNDAPVKTYIAPTDPRNAGKDATISYCTNGLLLGISPPTPPQFPASFFGRTTTTIIVMERSGLDGAHKWNATTNTTTLGKPGTPPPFPQFGADPAAYKDDLPQAFTTAGCVIGLGDGTARNITDNMADAWKWAANPKDKGPKPASW